MPDIIENRDNRNPDTRSELSKILVPSFEKCIFLSKRLVRMTSAGWCLKKVFHTERIHIHLILLGKLSQFTFYEYLLLDFLFSVTIKRVFSSSRHV